MKSDELAVEKCSFFISFQPITWRASARRVLTGAVTVHYFRTFTLRRNVSGKEEGPKKVDAKKCHQSNNIKATALSAQRLG